MKKMDENLKKTAKETLKKAKDMAENIDTDEINKNVQEISQKTKKELGKHSKKEIAAGIIIICILLAILSKIGWGNIFSGLFIVSICFLIYDIAKKKRKKNAVIAVILFAVLTGITGMSGSKGLDDNVLDYIGTKESVVYKTYNKNDFSDDGFGVGTTTNEGSNTNGLPYITIYNGKVSGVSIDSGMNASLHVNGLHLGDSLEDVTEWLDKSNALIENEETIDPIITASGSGAYQVTASLKYKGENREVIITIEGNLVSRITALAL